MRLQGLGRKLLISAGLGVAVLAALGIAGDIASLGRSLAAFHWSLLPAVLALTLCNYGLRFVKWQYMLRVLAIPPIRVADSLRIFFGGLAMTITPGKVGEWVKSALLKEATGAPISATAPIVFVERLSDGLAMAILASTGLLVYEFGWEILAGAAVVAILVVGLSQYRPLAHAAIAVAARIPLLGTRVRHLHTFYESARLLLTGKTLGFAVALGVVSWSAEGVAFYLILLGLGLPPSPTMLVQAIAILATSTIAGAVSMLPGGLAAAEGSIAGLLLLLGVVPDPTQAAAATLLIRFATLWFGVAVGFVSLATLSRSGLSTSDSQPSDRRVPPAG